MGAQDSLHLACWWYNDLSSSHHILTWYVLFELCF